MKVADIRELFRLQEPDPISGMLEIINASFIADEDTIFGEPNEDWHRRELNWYLSQSLFVKDIPAPVPAIWKQVASTKGEINSNYGWCIMSTENGDQFVNSIRALRTDVNTRQATMIYTRPSMHKDFNRDGMRDFICTNTAQMMIRGGLLHYIVNMRSNDAVFGFKGDLAWHKFVQNEALSILKNTYPYLKNGPIYWNAASLHVYPRHHDLVFAGRERV
jgi:thymidylate synthase